MLGKHLAGGGSLDQSITRSRNATVATAHSTAKAFSPCPPAEPSTTMTQNMRKGMITQLRVVKLSMRRTAPRRTLNNYLTVKSPCPKKGSQCLEPIPVNSTSIPFQRGLSDSCIGKLLTGCSVQDQALSQQSTYLGSQQCLGIIITRHENFHYCYQTPKSIFLFQVQKCNCYQPENRVYLEEKIVTVSQTILRSITVKYLFLFSRDDCINYNSRALSSKTLRWGKAIPSQTHHVFVFS